MLHQHIRVDFFSFLYFNTGQIWIMKESVWGADDYIAQEYAGKLKPSPDVGRMSKFICVFFLLQFKKNIRS